jgi:hypothetical protein
MTKLSLFYYLVYILAEYKSQSITVRNNPNDQKCPAQHYVHCLVPG